MPKRSMVIYHDILEKTAGLSNEEFGALMRAVIRYDSTGETEKLSPVLDMAFRFLKSTLDADREKYSEKCRKRAEAGRKGGQAKAKKSEKQNEANEANASKCKQTEANQADNCNLITDNCKLISDKLKEEGKEQTASAEPSRPSVNYQSIVDDYNATCTKLPACRKLSDARRKAIAARLKAYTPEELHRVFEKTQLSSFLTGQNERNWTANFDWILKDSNIAKILDGNYDNKKGQQDNGKNQYTQRFEKFTV